MLKKIIFLLMSSQVAVAQLSEVKTVLNSDLILKHTTYFNIQQNQFVNANGLTKALNPAQFVVMGELHNREKLGELTSALLMYLNGKGFENFALEIGPYSAEKLNQLTSAGKSNLHEFYKVYSSKLYGIYPIPFHTGKTDLNFLKVADSLGYNLWGIDQEYYFGYRFLMDDLKALNETSFSVEQERLFQKTIKTLNRWNKRSQLFKKFDMACRLQDDHEFQSFLNIFKNSKQIKIQELIKAIQTSLEIYCLSQQGQGGNDERIAYFKENFDKNLNNYGDSVPKVFVKMGSFHLGRYKSPLGLYDIGNYIKKLSDSINKPSVHLRYMNRFFNGKDNLKEKNWKNAASFIEVGKKNQWTLIDLRPLRQMLIDKTLSVSNFEFTEIANYDFIIIPPEDRQVKRHY